jgi:hypothetical protein
MQLVLNKWRALITGTLNPSNGIIFSLTKESISDLIRQSEAEGEAIRTNLIEGILDMPKIADKHQYVQVNQAILIRLLDKLYSYKQNPKVTDSVLCLYKTVSLHLENTLDFIEDFFSNYFDRNEKVPATDLLISIEELCRQLEQLKRCLKSSNSIGAKLANVVVKNFERFCNEKTSNINYNELMYQKDLMNELLTDGPLESEESLKEVLFYFNFNDYDYLAYLYERMKQLIESLSFKKEKIAALRFEQKNINQLSTKLNCYLSSTVPSLKEQVNHWIDEEIKFLSTDIADTSESSHKGDQYVHVSFKGAEIYLVQKAFFDAGGSQTET